MTRNQAAALARFERVYALAWWIVLPFVIGLAVVRFHAWWAAILFGLVWPAGSWFKLWHFTRGLEQATEIPTPTEAALDEARDRKARASRGFNLLTVLAIVGTISANWSIANVSRPVRQVIAVPLYILFLWWMFRKPKRDAVPNVGASPAAPS